MNGKLEKIKMFEFSNSKRKLENFTKTFEVKTIIFYVKVVKYVLDTQFGLILTLPTLSVTHDKQNETGSSPPRVQGDFYWKNSNKMLRN